MPAIRLLFVSGPLLFANCLTLSSDVRKRDSEETVSLTPQCRLCGGVAPAVLAGAATLSVGLSGGGLETVLSAAAGFSLERYLSHDVGQPRKSGTIGDDVPGSPPFEKEDPPTEVHTLCLPCRARCGLLNRVATVGSAAITALNDVGEGAATVFADVGETAAQTLVVHASCCTRRMDKLDHSASSSSRGPVIHKFSAKMSSSDVTEEFNCLFCEKANARLCSICKRMEKSEDKIRAAHRRLLAAQKWDERGVEAAEVFLKGAVEEWDEVRREAEKWGISLLGARGKTCRRSYSATI